MPGPTIGKQLNRNPRLYWRGQVTIEDKGSGIDFDIQAESDNGGGDLVRHQLEALVWALSMNLHEYLAAPEITAEEWKQWLKIHPSADRGNLTPEQIRQVMQSRRGAR